MSNNISFILIICSGKKLEAIIVNVLVFFIQNFCLTDLTFRVTFALLCDFSHSEFSAAELKRRQFTAKSQIKGAPKFVFFFTLNFISGCNVIKTSMTSFEAPLTIIVHPSPHPTEAGCNRLEFQQFVFRLFCLSSFHFLFRKTPKK